MWAAQLKKTCTNIPAAGAPENQHYIKIINCHHPTNLGVKGCNILWSETKKECVKVEKLRLLCPTLMTTRISIHKIIFQQSE